MRTIRALARRRGTGVADRPPSASARRTRLADPSPGPALQPAVRLERRVRSADREDLPRVRSRPRDRRQRPCGSPSATAQVVGSIFVLPSEGRPGTAQLRMLYVEPEARGLGLGRTLVDQVVTFSRDNGYRARPPLDPVGPRVGAQDLHRRRVREGRRERPPQLWQGPRRRALGAGCSAVAILPAGEGS